MVIKLFISYTGLILALKHSRVAEEDLKESMYYFGCTRDHVLQPGANGEGSELDWIVEEEEDRQTIHNLIVNAVLQAEKDGRAIFRVLGEDNSFSKLNELLTANGFDAVSFDQYGMQYNYPVVEYAIKNQGLPLEVLWRA